MWRGHLTKSDSLKSSKSDKEHPKRKMGKQQAIYGKVNPNGQQTLKFTSGDLQIKVPMR